MKKIGLILLTIIACAGSISAETFYEVFGLRGSALEKTGANWRAIAKGDILSENAVVKINANTKIEFVHGKYVYTLKEQKQDAVKQLIAYAKKKTVIDRISQNSQEEPKPKINGLVTVRDSVSTSSAYDVNDNEVYIIFYDSGRSLTAFILAYGMNEITEVEITEREKILDLIDECRATGKGLEPIYDDNRLYKMLWSGVEKYLKEDMYVVFEVPQYLYPVKMEELKIDDKYRMGNKYSMNSVEPRLEK